ncbi:hypothetical protein [Hasllibacter sp. MH4015]|uniref:hypothetical protein n=1 Tax=Hasllibacter sp. MH4015 TaxID=2854029 RepID=UPI001CD6E980|nr:hypothetical protein [Hasllibacter sp. MH4015]
MNFHEILFRIVADLARDEAAPRSSAFTIGYDELISAAQEDTKLTLDEVLLGIHRADTKSRLEGSYYRIAPKQSDSVKPSAKKSHL